MTSSESKKTLLTSAIVLLSVVVAALGAWVVGGILGQVLLWGGIGLNVFAVATVPLLDDWPDTQSLTVGGVIAGVVAVLFGLVFIGWGLGLLYALFAMVVYLGVSAVAVR